ncbi:hypothetical protein, partial [Streptomyces mirabilis]
MTFQSHPLTDLSGNPYGRSFGVGRDRAASEAGVMRVLPETMWYLIGFPGHQESDPFGRYISSDLAQTRPLPWPADRRLSYWLSLYGDRQHFYVSAMDGTDKMLTARELSRDVLRRRPSFTRLRPAAEPGRPMPRRSIVLVADQSGEVPTTADPLWHDTPAQEIADDNRDLYDVVYAPNAVSVTMRLRSSPGQEFPVRRVHYGRDDARMVEFRPLPAEDRLVDLAGRIGMHWPGTPQPRDRWRRDTLRALVRFLRHVFTVEVEDRADYLSLLEGAWALERMRINDPAQHDRRLTFPVLEELRQAARGAWGRQTQTDHGTVAESYWNLLYDAGSYVRNPGQELHTLDQFEMHLFHRQGPSDAPVPDPPLPVDDITTVVVDPVTGVLGGHAVAQEHSGPGTGPVPVPFVPAPGIRSDVLVWWLLRRYGQ